VFKTTPTLATFKRDCDSAGIDWQPDDTGASLDRHCLRKTFVTWLATSGAHPRTAQELARHTDIRLTMDTYTDPRLINTSAAVAKLPDLDPSDGEPLRATGTDARSAVAGVVPGVVPSVVPGVVLNPSDPKAPKRTRLEKPL